MLVSELGATTAAWRRISDLVIAGRHDEAIKSLKKDLETSSDPFFRAIALEHLGNVHRMLRQYPEAAELLTAAIAACDLPNPALWRKYVGLGLTFWAMGQTQKALDTYERAAERLMDRALEILAKRENPLLKKTVIDRERILLISPEIFPRIKDLFKVDPVFAVLRNNMGVCYAELGKAEKAIELFRESIEFTPDRARYEHPSLNLAKLQRKTRPGN